MKTLKKLALSWVLIPMFLMVFATGQVQGIATALVFGNWFVGLCMLARHLHRAITRHPKANAKMVANLEMLPKDLPTYYIWLFSGGAMMIGLGMLSLMRWGAFWLQLIVLIMMVMMFVYRVIFEKEDVRS